jgi:hypothetical protein
MSQANFSDDATSVVKAIQSGVKTEEINIDGQNYSTRPVYLPPAKPQVSALQVGSLDGLSEYLNKKVDGLDPEKLVIVINSHKSVSVFRQVEDAADTRTEWLEATYEVECFAFNRFLDHEQFMIQAQALITETEDRDKLLKFIGNLTTAAVQTSTDDGISQTVVVEQGVRKSAIELPNPVRLAPRRTFPEIDQPSSPFVVRVKQQREGLMPEIALFEADGGLWRVEAIDNIRRYLGLSLGGIEIPIIG